MPKLIVLLVLLSLSGCKSQGEDSIYILPKNYTGYVIVVYNQSQGKEKKYKGNKRVYEIPSSGILKTKFPPDHNRSNFPILFYEEIALKKQIPIIVNWENFTDTGTIATLPSIGKAYQEPKGGKVIEYAIFFIGTKNQIENFSNNSESLNIIDLIE